MAAAKYSPNKHSVEAYGRNMADIIGVAAYGGWHKICHAIMPWWKFDNTKIAIILQYTIYLAHMKIADIEALYCRSITEPLFYAIDNTGTDIGSGSRVYITPEIF
jgi:allophanate hydrolase subunit 1